MNEEPDSHGVMPKVGLNVRVDDGFSPSMRWPLTKSCKYDNI